MLVLLPVCYLGMAKATDTSVITLYALAIAFLGNAGYAPILIFLNERFPTEIRASGTGLSWNIGFALGGMMPTFVSLASASPAQIPMSLSIFVVVIFVDLPDRCVADPGDQGRFPLMSRAAAARSAAALAGAGAMNELAFDDVIVGGGSAGCVVANRLSANGARRVLLIEAGRDTVPGAEPAEILDSYPMPLFFGDRYIWPGLTASAGRVGNAAAVTRAYEQARVMGGGSSINVQSANRGLPRDYDEWRDLGAEGWGWDDVLPYFRKLETDLDFDGALHGKDGPIPIRRISQPNWPPFGAAVGAAFAESGVPFRRDQNTEFEDGIFPPAFSNRNDRRVSSAAAYLDAATRRRGNLAIWAGTHVEGLVMDGRRAEGVRVLRDGETSSSARGA